MKKFLSCDWGTSSFRLKLVDLPGHRIAGEENSSMGILEVFNRWNETGNTDPEVRRLFYTQVLLEHINKLRDKLQVSLDGIPIVISGMASSSIGMTPLPYGQVPFDMHGSGIETSYRQEEPGFRHDILLISGVKSNNDVMRGEETQLIGIYKEGMNTGLQTFIFPGTHSKHIAIEDNRAVDFRTYMTGEFFELLSKKSILHSSVEKNDDLQDTGSLKSFKQGVKDAMQSNLLHNCFKVRTNHLFGTFGRKENYHYLSGLLIGAEMQELQNIDAGTIYLCCGSGLKNYYEAAIAELGLDHRTHIFPARSVDESVIKGQGKILFKQAKNE